jgi:cellulose synthase/poly-beta-1,6-N-acetylglucosamine synthase-like glycosyltransferase/glycosyltransferase involved in cell wall biosynthesis
MVEVIFWLVVALPAYAYLVYPLCVGGFGRFARVRAAPAPAPGAAMPTVAVVVAACNEARHIEARIQNLLALDYPADRLAIYVGSDGSTDDTAARAAGHASARVHVLAFGERRGKASVLNDLLDEVSEEIVVFTDANTEFRADAVRLLVRHFANPEIGAVSGELRLQAAGGGDRPEASYWRLETSLKRGESRLGGLLGANGAIYAIRRELYRALRPDTLVDDFTVVMNVAAQGRQAIFEPQALAFEEVPPGVGASFDRRVRIGIGNYQAFFRHPQYWSRGRWARRFTYVSHKVLRWFSPHLLIVALLASLVLASRPLYATLFDLQVASYALLGAGMVLRRHGWLPGVARTPVFVFALNLAFLVAFCRYVTGRFSSQWVPRGAPARMSPPPAPTTPTFPELAGTGIVYFGNEWFAENRTSSHHIARRLPRHCPVLYVDSPGLRAPRATGRDLRRLAAKLRQALRRPTPLAPGLWHCTIPQLPFRRVPGVDALNRRFGRWAARRAIAAVGFERWVSWFVVPHPGFLAGTLGEEFVVYYCVDDYAAHPGVDAEAIAAADTALARRADQVFVASPALLEAKRGENPATAFAPHGVDAGLFARAADPATRVPERAAALAHPVVGFFGLLGDWIDVELLAHLGRARPEWTLLVVGGVATDVAPLAPLPNVVLAGAQPYEALPGWARAFDVAVIPYRMTRQVRHANPLKLREYLATGKPVVSVPTPEVERFAAHVRLARTPDEFLRAVEQGLQDDDEPARAARMGAVRDMSWEARLAEALELVCAGLARKRNGAPGRVVSAS